MKYAVYVLEKKLEEVEYYLSSKKVKKNSSFAHDLRRKKPELIEAISILKDGNKAGS